MSRHRDPLKILIVEDNPGDAALFQTFFKQDGRHTQFAHATDGEEAMSYLFRKVQEQPGLRPDLIVMDLNIPKIGGISVVREIKKNPRLQTIPVIVMTSSENEEDIRKSYEAGANCVLIKAEDAAQASRIFELIEVFWINTVRLTRNA